MKKILAFLLLFSIVLMVSVPALADTTDGNTFAAQDFFTWAALLTYAGAVLATTLVTQLLKGVGFIDKIPTRLFAYIVALIILIAATYFTGALTVEAAALCLVNAVVVALAASGAFDTIKKIRNPSVQEE